jgi:uncharacterized membrane protein YfcA
MIDWAIALPGLGLGLIAGTFSGMLGIGGGILMVPLLLLLFKDRITSMQMAVATSLAVMIPSALAGTLRNAFPESRVNWPLALVMGLGAIVGSYLIGVPLAQVFPSDTLKKIFGAVMMIFGLQMLGAGAWIGQLVKR